VPRFHIMVKHYSFVNCAYPVVKFRQCFALNPIAVGVFARIIDAFRVVYNFGKHREAVEILLLGIAPLCIFVISRERDGKRINCIL